MLMCCGTERYVCRETRAHFLLTPAACLFMHFHRNHITQSRVVAAGPVILGKLVSPLSKPFEMEHACVVQCQQAHVYCCFNSTCMYCKIVSSALRKIPPWIFYILTVLTV